MRKKRTEENSIAQPARRDFLKKGAAVGAVAAGGYALNLLAKDAHARPQPIPAQWDKEFDIIVIGSGFAGLAAGITAKEAGQDVIVLDKMPVNGGNSIINGGLMAAVNSKLQEKEGVKDSVDLYVSDLLKAGRGLNHVELIKIVATEGRDLPEWTTERGVEWNEKLEHLGGHSVPRTFLTTVSSGSGIVRPLTAYYQDKLKGNLQKKTKVIGFVREDTDAKPNGRVLGVEVLEDYMFDYKATDGDRHNTTGKKKFYKAKKGVVVASGGFSQDPFFRGIQDPSLAKPTDQLDSTNHPGATGEVLENLFKVGAAPIHLSWIQSGPWASPNEKGFGVGSSYQIAAGFRFGIMIDKKTGKRFVNELADRRTRAQAMFKVIGDPKNPSYPFTIADSQEGVAAHFNVPLGPFKAQIDEYNGYVKSGNDPQFGKPIDKNMKPLEKAPYYVMEGVPKTHHTMGGIMINTSGQVVEMETQQPIPGLYAAGEAVGGPHGASRLGSCAVPDCLVFGRICGRNLSKEKLWG